MIATLLELSRTDMKILRISDPYSLHRVVYGLFDDIRTEEEKSSSIPSGILYADKGGDFSSRKILILSNRPPKNFKQGNIQSKSVSDSFLTHDNYGFEVIINPTKRNKSTRKITPIRGRESLEQWFINKSDNWGFTVDLKHLQVTNLNAQIFQKKENSVTHNSATFIGTLTVTNRTQFIKSFEQGIGRGRAFGFGLLQLKRLAD